MAILADLGEAPVRLGRILSTDKAWAFILFLSPDATQARHAPEYTRDQASTEDATSTSPRPAHGPGISQTPNKSSAPVHEQTVRGAGRVERNMLRAVTGGVDELDLATLHTLNGVRGELADAHAA